MSDENKVRNYSEMNWFASALQPVFSMFSFKMSGYVAPVIFIFILLLLISKQFIFFIAIIMAIIFFVIIHWLGVEPHIGFRKFKRLFRGEHRYVSDIKKRRRRFKNGTR